MFPTVIGGIVPVMNLPGFKPGQLKMTGANIADIYRGAIKNWNDPLLAKNNPGLKLPSLPITVVHRSDGSGTTFLFTSYLSLEAEHWGRWCRRQRQRLLAGRHRRHGNDGVAAFVKQTPGSIGYVEYAFAKQNATTYALMQDKAGQFIAPTAVNFKNAAANAKWTTAPGFTCCCSTSYANAWPITGADLHPHARQADRRGKGKEVLNFFDWAYKNGDAAAEQLDHVPLPANVKDLIRKSWAKVVGPDGKPVYK